MENPHCSCKLTRVRSSRCSAGHQVALLLSEELSPVTGKPLVPMRTGNNFSSVWSLTAGTQAGMMQVTALQLQPLRRIPTAAVS